MYRTIKGLASTLCMCISLYIAIKFVLKNWKSHWKYLTLMFAVWTKAISRSSGYFGDSYSRNAYQVIATPYTRMYGYICYKYLKVPNFSLLYSTTKHFLVTSEFEPSTPNDHKTSSNTRSKEAHVYTTHVIFGFPKWWMRNLKILKKKNH